MGFRILHNSRISKSHAAASAEIQVRIENLSPSLRCAVLRYGLSSLQRNADLPKLCRTQASKPQLFWSVAHVAWFYIARYLELIMKYRVVDYESCARKGSKDRADAVHAAGVTAQKRNQGRKQHKRTELWRRADVSYRYSEYLFHSLALVTL